MNAGECDERGQRGAAGVDAMKQTVEPGMSELARRVSACHKGPAGRSAGTAGRSAGTARPKSDKSGGFRTPMIIHDPQWYVL